MAVTDADRLRNLLGEVIPSGGSASDTLFSDETIEDLLDRYDTVQSCLAEAWDIKASALADLVDTSEGDSKRAMSQAFKNAQERAKHFQGSEGSSAPSTRIASITREGWQG